MSIVKEEIKETLEISMKKTNFASRSRHFLMLCDCLNYLICRQRCDHRDRIDPRQHYYW